MRNLISERQKSNIVEKEKTHRSSRTKSTDSPTSITTSSSSLITLTVITGQNLAKRMNIESSLTEHPEIPDYTGSEGKVEMEDEEDDDNDIPTTTSKAYTLTKEVQRILIEDFFPPISSSTVPGNPGRLFITLTGDNND